MKRVKLADQVKSLTEDLERKRAECSKLREQVTIAETEEKRTKAQFGDLKERLFNAETDNQRLRGYIARVQEDDTVREELVATGDPAGEQRLVPKRKSILFEAPDNYGRPGVDHHNLRGYDADRVHPKRHWVTY